MRALSSANDNQRRVTSRRLLPGDGAYVALVAIGRNVWEIDYISPLVNGKRKHRIIALHAGYRNALLAAWKAGLKFNAPLIRMGV